MALTYSRGPALSMIETPPLFAETPGRSRHGSAVGHAARGPADRLGVSQRPFHRAVRLLMLTATTPMPADGADAPHQYLPSGRGGPLHDRDRERDAPRDQVGDILLMPFADRTSLERRRPKWPMAVALPAGLRRHPEFQDGGGGAETRLVCGFIESSEFLFTPLFRTLPELLVEQTGDDRIGALIASTVAKSWRSSTRRRRARSFVGRLMELLFVEVLRRHIARMPSGSPAAGSRAERPASSAAPCNAFMPSPASAGPPRASPAPPAPRAPCWPSGSTPCSAARRSTT